MSKSAPGQTFHRPGIALSSGSDAPSARQTNTRFASHNLSVCFGQDGCSLGVAPVPSNDHATSSTPCCHHEGSALDVTDLLAQFPTEHAPVLPASENTQSGSMAGMTAVAARTIDSATDLVSLSTFLSEDVVGDAPDPLPSLRRAALSALDRARRIIAVLWSQIVGFLRYRGPMLAALIGRALSHAWHTLEPVSGLRSKCRPLKPALVSAIRLSSSVLVRAWRTRARPSWHAWAHLLRSYRSWALPLISRRAHDRLTISVGALRALWATTRLPSTTRNRQKIVVTGRTAVQWTYPVGLFLSGVAVGAFLVASVRVPSDGAVATVVSANQAAAPSPSFFGRSSLDAPRDPPSAPRPARVDIPVSTRGVATAAARTAVAQAPRPERQPGQPGAFRGSFAISSRPQGAAVFMNGQHVGVTPLVLEDLPVGSRAVRLTLAGYETWSKSVQVVANQRTTIAAALNQPRGSVP